MSHRTRARAQTLEREGRRRASDAVHVVLGVARRIVIHDNGHPLDVNATGGHVGRHEQLDLALPWVAAGSSRRVVDARIMLQFQLHPWMVMRAPFMIWWFRLCL